MTYIKQKFRGPNYNRCTDGEKSFVATWQAMGGEDAADLLRNIMRTPNHAHLPEVSDRDRIVAGAVIQWLGSEEGQRYLYTSLEGKPPQGPVKTLAGHRHRYRRR